MRIIERLSSHGSQLLYSMQRGALRNQMSANTESKECGGFVTETLSILYTALVRAGTPIPKELSDRYAAAFKQARKLENV